MNDHRNRFNFLGAFFPKQFGTVPSIILWTLVFILDLAAVFWVAHLLGFPILNAARRSVLMIYLLIAFGLFCLESFVYNLIKQ